MKTMPDNSIDSVVTDPPYEIGFMGKAWDNTGIAYNVEMWGECLRVLKPGGHLLAFSGTRTYHRMACAIEDAGFEVRDMIEWMYGSGFPKSLNIGKAVDALQGNERESVGTSTNGSGAQPNKLNNHGTGDTGIGYADGSGKVFEITKGTSEWEGYGTALKPAHEPICLARKPLEKGLTIAENCLKWGTGGLDIDGCRVGENAGWSYPKGRGGNGWHDRESLSTNLTKPMASTTGRFPANLIHDNSEEVRECFPEQKSGARSSQHKIGNEDGEMFNHGIYGKYRAKNYDDAPAESGNASRFFKAIENNDRMVWLGTPEEEEEYNNLIAEMQDDQVFTEEQDKRYEELSKKSLVNKYYKYPKINRKYYKSIIYQAKSSKSDRNSNGAVKNIHPTCKPTKLMEYLIKMVNPKGGIVLDPFAGSGSTLVAAKQNGYQFIGIEKEPEYVKIIEARVAAAKLKPIKLL